MSFKHLHDIIDDIDPEMVEINDDPNDPEVIEVVIRGRLKHDIGRPRFATQQKQEEDPSEVYDRAMKGLECKISPSVRRNSSD